MLPKIKYTNCGELLYYQIAGIYFILLHCIYVGSYFFLIMLYVEVQCDSRHTPAKIVSASPEKGIFQVRERDVGVELHCQADGFPPPSITFERGNILLILFC